MNLIERIQAKAAALGQRAIAEMYQDPFWQARFGAHGREMAEKDSQFHLSYLVQALAASDPSVMTGYARWLQKLLVSRGMCSRHIAENFERLARALREEVEQPAPALELLRAGTEALAYDAGPARELQRISPQLAQAAVEVLRRRQSGWFSAASSFPSLAAYESVEHAETARFVRDLEEHIAYLADALAAGRPELFAEHALWTRNYLHGRRVPWARLEETLLAVDDCLGAPVAADGRERPSLRPQSVRPTLSPPPSAPDPLPLSPELVSAVRGMLAAALERLAAPSEPGAAPVPGSSRVSLRSDHRAQGSDAHRFGFSQLVRDLEALLVATLQLEPRPLPPELERLQGVFREQPAALEARAYRGRSVAYARCVELSSAELEIGNLVLFPKPDRALPLLGIDLVALGRETAIVVADLSPLTADRERRVRQLGVLVRQCPVAPALERSELPAWASSWFSERALCARIRPEQSSDAAGVVQGFVQAFLELEREEAHAPEGQQQVAERQHAYCAAHRKDDRGLLLLRRIFHPHHADRFLREVLFPEEDPDVKDYVAAWEAESREVVLACDEAGNIVWLDARAQAKLGTRVGAAFSDLAAPGGEEKALAIVLRGRSQAINDSELPLLIAGRLVTASFCAKPDGQGGTLLLGSLLHSEYAGALEQVQASVAEVVELNRQVSRQKRDIERQKLELETAHTTLGESNRAVLTLHAELEDRAASLKRVADVKGRVVANVSHEFRTPLHTILGLSGILLDAADGPLTEEQRKQVRYIRTSAEELQQLVNDLLDLSKAESGKAQLRPEKFTISELFAAMRGQLRPLIDPSQPVELRFEEPEVPLQLETDHGKVAQVLRNLVSNALKFTEHGEVVVSARPKGDRIAFEVRDTGIGIHADDQERVFEEFGQVDSHLQKRVKGTGLGLPLSRRLAELLDGELLLESELGKGSSFTLTIPIVHPEVSELASLTERPLDPGKAPILVVEDDRKTIFVYEKYLSMAGFQVVPARTIEDARRLMQTTRPAAVVLDIMLEGETTWEFLAELKRAPETSDIPVLVVTVTSKAQKARALGADEFWLKPVNPDRLINKLKSLTRPGQETKILVIDDDERARYLMRRLLKGTPYGMSEAGTGPEGVRLARESRPNLIFLDFLLQEMTAFDVLDELKADPQTRTIPVIVVTSHMLDATERKRLAADTEAVLSKENLSRELAINRIRDALSKAGVATAHGS